MGFNSSEEKKGTSPDIFEMQSQHTSLGLVEDVAQQQLERSINFSLLFKDNYSGRHR